MKPTLLSFVTSIFLGLFAWGFNVANPDIPAIWGQLAMFLALLGLAVTVFFALRDFRNFFPANLQAGTQPFPDWTIRELFLHIDPYQLEDDNPPGGSVWRDIGDDVKDHLSAGDLIGWGRKAEGNQSITKIRKSYWSGSNFTYWFFDSDGNNQSAHVLKKNDADYRDLRVNRAQALKIWPNKQPLDANDNSIWWAFAVPIIFLLILASPMAFSDASKAINYAYPHLKGWVFRPIEPSLGIEDALIRPYQSDPSLLEIGLEIKNVSDKLIHFRVQDFVISIDGDKRLYLTRKATDTKSSMGTMLWFNAFSDVLNPKQQFATFDFTIEYGPKKNVTERLLIATFSCDLVRGKQVSTDCIIKKESDDEIP